MNLFRPLAIVAAALSLGACTHLSLDDNRPDIHVSPRAPVVAPKADPLSLKPVEWKVYNTTELKALADQIAQTGQNVVLFTLDEDNFKALSTNLTDIQSFIKQQNSVIIFLTKAANQQPDPSKPEAK